MKRSITIISAFVILLSLAISSPAIAQPCVVITTADQSIRQLSSVDVERIFLGKMKKWPDGTVITVVYNDEDLIRATFSEKYLRRSWRQVSIYWRKKLYSGRSMLPIFVAGDDRVKEYLLSHPNAISYVAAEGADPRFQVIEVQP